MLAVMQERTAAPDKSVELSIFSSRHMNRIYQGKVSKAGLLPLRLERGEGRGEVSKLPSAPPTDWNWEATLWDYAQFQDAVNPDATNQP